MIHYNDGTMKPGVLAALCSQLLPEIHQNLPVDWELLYLGHWSFECEYQDKKPLYETASAYKMCESVLPYCTHAYSIVLVTQRRNI